MQSYIPSARYTKLSYICGCHISVEIIDVCYTNRLAKVEIMWIEGPRSAKMPS